MNCLSCGHAVDLRDAYDDYEGQVKCFACGSLLAIRTQDGQVKQVQTVGSTRSSAEPGAGADVVAPTRQLRY